MLINFFFIAEYEHNIEINQLNILLKIFSSSGHSDVTNQSVLFCRKNFCTKSTKREKKIQCVNSKIWGKTNDLTSDVALNWT